MILIIDDDIAVCASLNLLLKQAGFEVHAIQQPDEALQWLRLNTPQLILMDMNFSIETNGREGLELLQKVRVFHAEVPVILITGWGTINLAVEGIKSGASDFVTKPWDNDALLESVRTNIQMADLSTEPLTSSRKELEKLYDLSGIIGEHEELLELLSMTGRIASSEATVLISGESGTGKELIAEAIHRNSKRRDKAFVKVNLGGISESLFESELFGHKKGAFTDASSDRKGRFEMAEGGTIFLDEIGELSSAMQVKLLRVLQEHTYEILGDSKTRKADVRVVCATNRDLAKMVREESFREDLYYRINLIQLYSPSLRERVTDIPVLANHFVLQTCLANKLPVLKLTKEACSFIKKYPFPGNIRELKNLMERAALMIQGLEITEADVQKYLDRAPSQNGMKTAAGLTTLDELEKNAIVNAMEVYKGNVSRVARNLGLSRGALYRRFEKYNIPYEH
ncbi:MAG: sigma-54-dependent Fis family transcriptional regulator [Bacteroidales bacterium]|nr:sigma-54-dependent Fis family transcriptional regulator [Bacteroidales bacterium]